MPHVVNWQISKKKGALLKAPFSNQGSKSNIDFSDSKRYDA